jgi:hypothetical protein
MEASQLKTARGDACLENASVSPEWIKLLPDVD